MTDVIVEGTDSVVEIVITPPGMVEVVTGPAGEQGPPGPEGPVGSGLSMYTSMADLNTLQTAEMGVLTVPNMKAAFTGVSTTGVLAAMGEGMGSLIVMSTLVDEYDWSVGVDSGYRLLVQTAYFDNGDGFGMRILSRQITFSETDPGFASSWAFSSFLAPGQAGKTEAPYWTGTGWGTRRVSSVENANEFMMRDASGRARVQPPSVSLDIANKFYVDTGGWSTVPTTATSSGVSGAKARDANFLYICVATNSWRRVALSTW